MGMKHKLKQLLRVDEMGCKESQQLLDEINGYAAVSFDIFDTLLKRDVSSPTHVFREMERQLQGDSGNTNSFVQARIKAEEKAREMTGGEVTLRQIYEQVALPPTWSVDALVELEENMEIALCTPNPMIKKVYDACLASGVKIYVISDMYLAPSVLEKMLEKCGYRGYQRLYVSCQEGVSKRDGGLYRIFLDREHLQPHQVIHIGDDLKADVLQAKKNGLRACKIPRRLVRMEYYGDNGLNQEQCRDYKDVAAFLDNRLERVEDPYERLGFEVFGPLLYGFADWIGRQAGKGSKLYFVSRDGYIVKQAYERLKQLRGWETEDHYLYCSRRSLYLPALYGACTWERATHYISVHQTTKADVVFERFGISPEELRAAAQSLGIDPEQTYSRGEFKTHPDVLRLFEYFSAVLKQAAKEEYQAMDHYFLQENFSGPVTLVDIGWRGSIQKALEELDQSQLTQPYQVYELYLAIRHDAVVSPEHAKGYLVNFTQDQEMLESFAAYNALIEMFFSAPHGSVTRYMWDKESGKPEIAFQPYEYRDEVEQERKASEIMVKLRNGALRFVEEFGSSFLGQKEYSPRVLYQNLLRFGGQAKLRDAQLFGDFPYHDTTVQPVAKPKSLGHYMFHLGEFKYDFATSAWRVAFLRRLFKINLPYYRMFQLMYGRSRGK